MRSFLLASLLFTSSGLLARENTVHYKDSSGNRIYNEWLGMKTGFFVGPAMCNMWTSGNFPVGDFVWRPTVGLSFQLDLSKIWAMEYDIQISSKGYTLTDSVNDVLGNFLSERFTETKCSYMSLPVLFKINARKKSGVYFSFGGFVAFQTASKQSVIYQESAAGGDYNEKGFNKFSSDVGLTSGIGSEIGLKNYQVGMELRCDIGFLNVNAPAGYAYQHHIGFSLLISVKYKKPKPVKVFKGVGDL